MEQQAFINKVKDGAINTMNKYGVLASLTIAQSILESGWGGTALANSANNLFGIKRHGSDKYVTMPTREYNEDGSSYMIQAEFRAYESWDESISDHGKFFVDNPRYHNLLGLTDYKKVCNLVREDGYATDPNYGNLLIDLVERYKLDQYDKKERKNFIMYVESYYLANNPDIRQAVQQGTITAKEHYENYGKAEGRRGFPELPRDFCEGAYLDNNPDIAKAIEKGDYTCGAEHWLLYGWNENRRYRG
jgi:hypothetical protein